MYFRIYFSSAELFGLQYGLGLGTLKPSGGLEGGNGGYGNNVKLRFSERHPTKPGGISCGINFLLLSVQCT